MKNARGDFISFHVQTILSEMSTVPQPDLGFLFFAMSRYSKGDDAGFTLDNYGEGLLMLKKKGMQGRCLFSHDDDTGPRPVTLLIYKKETQEAPDNLIATARERRGKYIEARKRKGV